MAWNKPYDNFSPRVRTKGRALTGLLVAIMMVPTASAYVDIPPVDDQVDLYPTVDATPYELVEAQTTCTGQYALHSSTEIVEQGWWLLVFWTAKTKVSHSSSIDYTFECSARFTTTISGSGGVDRFVGVRAMGGQSGGLGDPMGLGNSVKIGVGDLIAWEEELDDGCDYLIGGCSTSFSVDVKGGETRVDQDKTPDKVCDENPPEVEAFNRPNTGGQNLGPLGPASSVVEATQEVNASTDKLCVDIKWEKVDDLALVAGIKLV